MSYRVIQWATGSIGRVTLRHVIDSPHLELVGVKVYDERKAGRDAGDLVRRPKTGVAATTDIGEIVGLDANVVLHVPLNGSDPDEHVEDLERLLRSGKNVITTVGFTYPWAVSTERAARLENAAIDGRSTLFGTGINPGTIAERLAVTATSICTQVRSLSVQEVYDCTPVASPGFVFDLIGFGLTESDFWTASAGRATFFEDLFGEVMGFLTDRMRLPVSEVRPDHAVRVAAEDLTVPAGVIPAGGVSGVRWQWHGIGGPGDPPVTIRMIWFIGPKTLGWDLEDGWEIEIEGAPRVRMSLQVLDPIGLPDRSKAIQYAVAGPVIRAIADVCAAEPGILMPPTFAAFTSEGGGG